jgi:sugar phosphate isomerase/epimerase
MELCVHTDSLADLPLGEALDVVAGLGIRAVEVPTGGQSPAPHLRLTELLENAATRAAWAAAFAERGIRIAAVNCSAWPMHPVYGAEHVELVRRSIELAHELGVDTIVTMSGCPGDSPHGRAVNWITAAWPPDLRAILDEQWDQAVALWQELAAFALGHGVTRIALELHPLHLVYNVPTLLRLCGEIGPVIGANLDPSHLFWQQMDPIRAAGALGSAVYHVHLKDTAFFPDELALTGVLDPRPEDDAVHRSWIFRTIGEAHPPSYWRSFVDALREIGYDGVLSIENEDPLLPGESGVAAAAALASGLLRDQG